MSPNSRGPAPELSPRPNSRAISADVKLATAHVLAHFEGGRIGDVVAREYGKDRAVMDLHTRGAATISSTSSVTALSMTAGTEFAGGFGASSAGAQLLSSEGVMQVSLAGLAGINVAGGLAVAAGATYVLEGDPVPVRQQSYVNATLAPRKFAVISAYSADVLKYSKPSIEAAIRDGMSTAFALQFDALTFDNTIGDGTRNAGLRYGISANATGASASTSLSEAMNSDLQTIISAVSAAANNGPIVIVAAPRQAVALRLRQRSTFQYPVFSSSGLSDKDVIAVALNCLVSAVDPVPRFLVSDQGTLHLDTAPTALSTSGSPNVVAAKIINLFQQNCFSLRATYDVAYALRHSSGLSWLTNVKW